MNFHFKNEVSDSRSTRQPNTSPVRSRKSSHENKNSATKNAFKRNLFGDLNSDQSPAVLAKQLIESPLRHQTLIFNDSSIHSLAKKHPGGKETKGNISFNNSIKKSNQFRLYS